MRQFNIDFFDRTLSFVYHDVCTDPTIEEDYLNLTQNTIEIGTDTGVSNGYFIYMTSGDIKFFGVVTDVSPGDHVTTIRYKPFLSLFDEDLVFDTSLQNKSNQRSLELVLKDYIEQEYKNSSDTLQNLPISVSVATSTTNWTLGLESDNEELHYTVTGLFKVLIVEAMKKYGIGLNVTPNFGTKRINITISTFSLKLDIDGMLDNVTVKTLKANDRPDGLNKLEVYDATDYVNKITFYLYTDRTWGYEDKKRITPVAKEVTAVNPDSSYSDPTEAFLSAAADAAYSRLAGLAWDNLIELEVMPNDPLVDALNLQYGQTVSLWYQGGQYVSILTGKTITPDHILLTFGSERIQFTKRSRR